VAFLNTYRGTVKAARALQPEDIPPELIQRLIEFLRAHEPPRSRRPD